jgi:diaminohydroxyphosphoribosylaminopyrimidine deaminase/5-amino-6-(5-phosphoribosylamino)uracil reductase
MRRAIREARRAEGRTHPNPLVGCVIVRDDEVVATGHHEGPGAAHAEVAALEQLDGSAEGCDVYVNLEPCRHHGRTSPCTDALIDADVERVFVAVIDPDERMEGRGVQQLREAGIEVVVGVLEEEARQLNEGYFKYVREGIPWVSVKYAMTLDGKIATASGDSSWVTGEEARRRVHEFRDRYDGIMVGTGTLVSDNPRLTCRIKEGEDPTRVILDAGLDAPLDLNVFRETTRSGEPAPDTLVVVGEDRLERSEVARRADTLRERGLEIIPVGETDQGFLDLGELLEELAAREIVRLFVEGGGRLIGSLFDGDKIDHVYAFVAPKLIGGADAPGPNRGSGRPTMKGAADLADPDIERLGSDLLISGRLEQS